MMAVMLVRVIIAHPLPDVAGHVVQAVGAGAVMGFVAVVGLAVVEADRGGVAQLAIHLLKKIGGGVVIGVVAVNFVAPGEWQTMIIN